VLTSSAETGPAFGAAILAGVGTGVFPSVEKATDSLISIEAQVVPDEAEAAHYARYRAVYDRLYPALKEEFAALKALV
jgi:xylulokinase